MCLVEDFIFELKLEILVKLPTKAECNLEEEYSRVYKTSQAGRGKGSNRKQLFKGCESESCGKIALNVRV